MKVSKLEQESIRNVCELGSMFGYGNLISHLKAAWAATLMKQYGFTEEEAQKAAGEGGLPIEMHQDIINNGEWDETGKRYMKKNKSTS